MSELVGGGRKRADDPISASKESGWYWVVTGIRDGYTGPLMIFAIVTIK